MYTEISKQKQGSPCKNSHQRCFQTTNFDRLHREELLFVPRYIYTHRLNSFSSTISQQNTHFNMYIETSKQQQGFPCKNSHQKCFKKDKFWQIPSRIYKSINIVVNVGASVMFLIPLCFHVGLNYSFLSRSIPPLNFTELNSYSTEITSQYKLFNMYIVKKKATTGS